MDNRGELENINLSGIEFSKEGDCVTLHLVNTLSPYGNSRFECQNIYSFVFHRTSNDKIPYYLGELTWIELGEAEKHAALKRIKYPMFNQKGNLLIMKEKVVSIHLEGSVFGDILAESVMYTDFQISEPAG